MFTFFINVFSYMDFKLCFVGKIFNALLRPCSTTTAACLSLNIVFNHCNVCISQFGEGPLRLPLYFVNLEGVWIIS